jgi:hypothetical protein
VELSAVYYAKRFHVLAPSTQVLCLLMLQTHVVVRHYLNFMGDWEGECQKHGTQRGANLGDVESM